MTQQDGSSTPRDNVVYEPDILWPPEPNDDTKSSVNAYNATLRKLDWLVPELCDEIDNARPKPADLDAHGNYNQERLQQEFSRIFYAGRCFYNWYQLLQMVQRFADAWGFDVFRESSSIKCCFAKSNKRPKPSVVPVEKQRDRGVSPKESIHCPFELKVSWAERTRKTDMTHASRRKVKITHVTAHHTCVPGMEMQRVAKSKNGRLRRNETFTIDFETAESIFKEAYDSCEGRKDRILRLIGTLIDLTHEFQTNEPMQQAMTAFEVSAYLEAHFGTK